jgi:hypothetical protein
MNRSLKELRNCGAKITRLRGLSKYLSLVLLIGLLVSIGLLFSPLQQFTFLVLITTVVFFSALKIAQFIALRKVFNVIWFKYAGMRRLQLKICNGDENPMLLMEDIHRLRSPDHFNEDELTPFFEKMHQAKMGLPLHQTIIYKAYQYRIDISETPNLSTQDIYLFLDEDIMRTLCYKDKIDDSFGLPIPFFTAKLTLKEVSIDRFELTEQELETLSEGGSIRTSNNKDYLLAFERKTDLIRPRVFIISHTEYFGGRAEFPSSWSRIRKPYLRGHFPLPKDINTSGGRDQE